MLDFHVKLWQGCSKENGHSRCPNEDGTLYLRVNEVEFLNQQLKQKIADLTSNIYLKEAELQYCHSQVARYRTEAVLLAQGTSCLKSDLEEYEYQLECQSKELTALRREHSKLTEEMAATKLQKEELLDRWLEEKKQEAVRINKHNATQERWHRLAGRLKKRYRGRSRPLPFVAANTNSSDIKPTESNI
ncbi:autophagy-related protein 16-1 [Pimephales promelas]|nr:autophagy-related protein 16-1 [Pimephales promelas]